jgi:hypothetical protein
MRLSIDPIFCPTLQWSVCEQPQSLVVQHPVLFQQRSGERSAMYALEKERGGKQLGFHTAKIWESAGRRIDENQAAEPRNLMRRKDHRLHRLELRAALD